MPHPVFLVDAFAGAPFAGNPAGVVLLTHPEPEPWMQALAMEMNQAETAFLRPGADGFELRWFTPTIEVDLCGHATLGSAHVLWEEGRLGAGAPARFHTRSGLLTAVRDGEWITLDFPATPPTPAEAPANLREALGLTAGEIYRSKFDYLVLIENPALLRNLRPDLRALATIPARGVVVTCRSDRPDADFLSRFFAPQSGVNEDPVTGSAHCALAPFWAGRLARKELIGYQASDRGGFVRVQDRGDRVLLSGTAVTVLRGEVRD